MTTHRNRRQNIIVRPRPRAYEALLNAHDSNTNSASETLVKPNKGKRLRLVRVKAVQENQDGRRLYEIYFGDGANITADPAKAVDTLDIPDRGEASTRVFLREEGPRGERDEVLSGRWQGESPSASHKIMVEYTEEN